MAELSPLRRRMIEDMTIRNLSPATQRSYIHAVAKFSRYFGRSLERLGSGGRDVRAFQVHLVAGYGASIKPGDGFSSRLGSSAHLVQGRRTSRLALCRGWFRRLPTACFSAVDSRSAHTSGA